MWETYLDNTIWGGIGFLLGLCAGRASNALRDIREDTRKLLDRTEASHDDT